MSERNKSRSENPTEEKKFKTSKLLKSRQLAGYQQDFARVILTKEEYTIAEAKKTLDRALKGGK